MRIRPEGQSFGDLVLCLPETETLRNSKEMKLKTTSQSRELVVAARYVGLDGNVGLRSIADAISKKIRRFPPKTKVERWALIHAIAAEYPVELTTTPRKRNHGGIDVQSDEFLKSYEWRKLRLIVLKNCGRRCGCCGAIPSPDNQVVLHVDHIKPRRLFPHLALVESNLQVLCEACNHGKGNWDQTDWR